MRSLPLLCVLAIGCGGGSGAPDDGGRRDVGRADAAITDAGTDAGADSADAEFEDAGLDDASLEDSRVDAPPPLGPPYPIVLAHGFFGFEEFAGLDFATYFFEVREHLEDELVFTPAVDPFNDSTDRGRELVVAIEAILGETGHDKVNLIGHSQGGLDARFVASTRPDLVASVTTIATPHRGTPLLDVLLGIVEDDRLATLVDDLVRLIGAPLYDAAGEETSLFDALRQLSREGATAFNERYPDDPSIPYYSITGRSDRRFAVRACRPDGDLEDFMERWDGFLDPVDPLLAISEAIVDGGLGQPFPNDGLVRIEDARWGRFLGCIPADHLDQVGHLLGDGPGFGNAFDHKEFFEGLVAWLRAQGL
ncbi:MAG: alpha/beta fold hydrolase [Myxococcota bacterium]